MPKYTFHCDDCGNEVQQNVPSSKSSIPCVHCYTAMRRLLPKLNGSPRVNETVDKYMGAVRMVDQEEQVKLRKDEYYWTVEVPRFVQSGIYSVETMLENEWITLDDKGQVQVNNVPPHRR